MISEGSADVSAPNPFSMSFLKEKPAARVGGGGSNLDKHGLSVGNLSAEASPRPSVQRCTILSVC